MYSTTVTSQQRGPYAGNVRAAAPHQPSWRIPVVDVLQHGLSSQPALPLQPPFDPTSSTYMMRLHVGRALSAMKNPKQRLQAAQTVYSLIQPLGSQLRQDVAAIASAVQCSTDLAASTAEIRLLVHRTPEAMAAAVAVVQQQQFQVGSLQIPASLQVAQQPAGTIRVLLCQPPPGLVRRGLTLAVLAAAGYTRDVEVVAEFIGGDNQLGAAATALPCINTVVAWVKPPAHDRYLQHLPDSFSHGHGTTQVFVQGRKAGAWQLWQQQEDELEVALQYLQQVLQRQPTPPDTGGSQPQQPRQQPEPQRSYGQPQQQQQQHHQSQQSAPRRPDSVGGQIQQPNIGSRLPTQDQLWPLADDQCSMDLDPVGSPQLASQSQQQQQRQQHQTQPQQPTGARVQFGSHATTTSSIDEPSQVTQQQLRRASRASAAAAAEKAAATATRAELVAAITAPLIAMTDPPNVAARVDDQPQQPNHLFALLGEQAEQYHAWVATPVGQEVGSEAVRLSTDVLGRHLGTAEADQLRVKFFLEQKPSVTNPPSAAFILEWLHQQLQLPVDAAGESEYGAMCADDPGLAVQQQSGPQQQQHTPRADQPAANNGSVGDTAAVDDTGQQFTPRRSARANAGRQSANFSRVYGSGFYSSQVAAPQQTAVVPTPSAVPAPSDAVTASTPRRPKGRHRS